MTDLESGDRVRVCTSEYVVLLFIYLFTYLLQIYLSCRMLLPDQVLGARQTDAMCAICTCAQVALHVGADMPSPGHRFVVTLSFPFFSLFISPALGIRYVFKTGEAMQKPRAQRGPAYCSVSVRVAGATRGREQGQGPGPLERGELGYRFPRRPNP